MRQLARSAALGAAFGGLGYGAILSLVHVVYNRLGSPRVALVLLAACLAIYGAAGAAWFSAGHLAVRGAQRALGRRPVEGGADDLRDPVLAGLFAFNLLFWLGHFLYGVTYDQVPWGGASLGGMLAFLAASVALVAAACLGVSWLLAGPLSRFAVRRPARTAGAALAGAALLHLGAALALGARGAAAPAVAAPAEAAPPIVARPGGVPVVLVGLDGATWRVMEPMIARGELPRLARLAAAGASGELATLADANSAVIWASIYTGEGRREHGILDFYRIHLPGMGGAGVYPVHQTFFKEAVGLLEPLGLARRRPVDRLSLAAPPLWEILDRLEVSMGIVDGYYFSYPAVVPETEGSWVLAYGLDVYFPRLRQGDPRARRSDLPRFLQPPELLDELAPHLGRRDFEWQSRALLHLLRARGQPRFVNLYTHQPDSVQHLNWKWYEPELFPGVSPAEAEERGERIPEAYRGFDAFFAQLLPLLAPETAVIVLSDHGQAPTILHRDFFTQHRHGPPGVIVMHGGPVRAGVRLEDAHVLDVFPTVLHLLGLPVPEDAAGRVLVEALDPGWLRDNPIRSVPSYAAFRSDTALEEPGSRLEAEELEKLKALGYI